MLVATRLTQLYLKAHPTDKISSMFFWIYLLHFRWDLVSWLLQVFTMSYWKVFFDYFQIVIVSWEFQKTWVVSKVAMTSLAFICDYEAHKREWLLKYLGRVRNAWLKLIEIWAAECLILNMLVHFRRCFELFIHMIRYFFHLVRIMHFDSILHMYYFRARKIPCMKKFPSYSFWKHVAPAKGRSIASGAAVRLRGPRFKMSTRIIDVTLSNI